MQLDPAHHGQRITLAPGELLVLSLPENPTTGYRWALLGDTGWQVEDSEFVGGTQAVPGAAGTRVMRLKASRPGLLALRMACMRSWESESAAIGRFDLSVDAR